MPIRKLQLKNFKRFTDLTINLGEETPRLVLLIGANGSGKSSVFDAFSFIQNYNKYKNGVIATGIKSLPYYAKDYDNFEINIKYENEGFIDLKGDTLANNVNISKLKDVRFYGRTAFRHTPEISKVTVGTRASISDDSDRPNRFIEYDTRRFSSDIDIFVARQLKAFNEDNSAVRKDFNKKFNNSFKRIFKQSEDISLQYVDFNLPAEGKSFNFTFEKGFIEFDYHVLSAGEKAVFELLFDLYIRKALYEGGILYLDEIDLHLHTSLQYALLKELTSDEWLPENSQLWVASHSLGFIDYTREYGQGVIIDLDNLDFDREQALEAKQQEDFDVFDVVFGNPITAQKYYNFVVKGHRPKIVLSEGRDYQHYRDLEPQNFFFTDEYGKGLNKNNVINLIAQYNNIYGIIDRDLLTDEEVCNLTKQYKNLRVLDYYCIENYLYHPENIKELKPDIDIERYKKSITEVKNNELEKLKTAIRFARSKYRNHTLKDDGSNSDIEISRLLSSDNFGDFYKVFSMKDYCKELEERQNLNKEQLANTGWFKLKILKLLNR